MPTAAAKSSSKTLQSRPRARGLRPGTSTRLLKANDIPALKTPKERIDWLAQRMVKGFYTTGDHKIAALKWKMSPRTVEHYAETASKIVEYTTNDIELLRNLSLVRLEAIADGNGPDKLRAVQTALQVTGLLRGGASDSSSSPQGSTLTAEQAEFRMISAIKSPDARMLNILRQAFEQANPRLRALLDEFTGVITAGETVAEPPQLQPVNPDQ